METPDETQSKEPESYQDAAIRNEYESYKAKLSESYAALQQAYTTDSSNEPARVPKALSQFLDNLMNPERVHRLASFGAERQYLEEVHKRYFKDEVPTSNAEHVAAITSRLAERKHLCAPYVNEYWPPRPMPENINREHYIVGNRFIPPEDIGASFMLPYNVIQHQARAEDLVRSAKTCPLCELLRVACIMDSFRERGEGDAFDHSREPLGEILGSINRESGSLLFNRIACQISQSQEPLYLMLWKDSNWEQESLSGAYKLNYIRLLWQRPKVDVTRKERKTVFTRLQVFHSKDYAPELTPYISSHQPLYDSGARQAFDLMTEWFQNCKADHPECRKTMSGEAMDPSELHKLPSRLVDVGPLGSETEPRLVETAGYPDGQWVALSHCWGEAQKHPLKTTRENLIERVAGIPLATMPKSFVDAIAVTKFLGLRYIWIDSLCIIQEDEEDWHAESKHMGSVYEKAVLTIAASSAEDSTEGLFMRRPYANLEVPAVQVPLLLRNGYSQVSESLGQFSIGIEWRQEPFMKELDPMDTALSKRGWATQEWILSRRIIHFLDRGLVWVCKSNAVTETGYLIVGRGLPRKKVDDQWGQIVQEHSSRLFTYQRDRLVSLEGLASKYKHFKHPSDVYAFGIWESDMPLHLLWSPKMLAWDIKDEPSWSWASCPHAIWFRIREIATRHDCESFTSKCSILGVDLEMGSLKLKAQKWEIQEHLVQEFSMDDRHVFLRGRANHRFGYYITALDGDEEPFGWAVFDDARRGASILKSREDQRIFFLYLSDIEFSTAPTFESYGILLAKAPPGKKGFVRLGVAAMSTSAWIKSEPTVEIEVI